MSTRTYGLPAYDCLCSDLGIWARALTRAGGSLQVISVYPGLPAGTTSVDVALPGRAPYAEFRWWSLRTPPIASGRPGPG